MEVGAAVKRGTGAKMPAVVSPNLMEQARNMSTAFTTVRKPCPLRDLHTPRNACRAAFDAGQAGLGRRGPEADSGDSAFFAESGEASSMMTCSTSFIVIRRSM